MAWLDEPWLRMAYESLRATLKRDARQTNAMVQFLLDEGFWDAERLNFDSAIARFNSCLNPNKSEFFKLGELWALMKRFGHHELFHAMAEDLGYEVRRKPTEERRLELLDRLATVTEQLQGEFAAVQGELARLVEPSAERPQRPSGGPKPQFSLDGTRTEVP